MVLELLPGHKRYVVVLGRNGACGQVGQDLVDEVLGGGSIWMPSKMKQGVPKKFSYIHRVTQELFGGWISNYERLQVFRAEGASNSAFHLDPPDQTTVKLSLRFGFIRGP